MLISMIKNHDGSITVEKTGREIMIPVRAMEFPVHTSSSSCRCLGLHGASMNYYALAQHEGQHL